MQYVDLPSRDAIYEIVRSSLCEIVGKGIVNPIVSRSAIFYPPSNKSEVNFWQNVPTLKQAQMYEATAKHTQNAAATRTDPQIKTKNIALRLLALATQCRVRRYIPYYERPKLTKSGQQTQNLSGRALRRLPVLALARYIGIGNLNLANAAHGGSATPNVQSGAEKNANGRSTVGADVEVWLEGMEKVVKEQKKELERLM